jgi:hypothetical protein
MRGRKARSLHIRSEDLSTLERVAHGHQLPSFVVDRARIVLAVAEGMPIASLAALMRCDRTSIWRTCRRYEQGGIKRLFLNEPRLGRLQDISPSAARPDRGVGLSGADCKRAPHYALDEQ